VTSFDEANDLNEGVTAIHHNLAACLELPVERTASRWIGEAEAVARDLAEADPDEAVVAERLGHIQRLLGEVEATGDERASEHVARAEELTGEALERLE